MRRREVAPLLGITGGGAGLARHLGVAASPVLSSAEELGRQSETLRADVNRFLEKIRAA